VGSPITQVSAQFGTRYHQQQADDTGLIFVRYANGVAGTIVSVGYSIGAPKHLTELTCTKGMLNIDYVSGVSIGRDEKWQPVPNSGLQDWMHEALVREWEAFIRAVCHGEPPAVSGEYARHIMAAVFAAEESSRMQREVSVS